MNNGCLFNIEECSSFKITDTNYQKLELSSEDRASVYAFLSQIPSLTSASVIADAYICKFPEGVIGTLMKYKDGGVGSTIMFDGKIIDHAAFYSIANSANILAAFSIMAAATAQFFMVKISDDFDFVKQRIDKILDFLYGDKKAELFAEISFVKQIYENFSSIMKHTEQRLAAIVNLQNAQKVAMKDIEFYINDLTSKSKSKPKTYDAFCSLAEEAIRIKDCLTLAIQLYATASLIEANVALNTDASYLKYLKDTLSYYVRKTEGIILSCFSGLRTNNANYKPNAMAKFNTKPLDEVLGNIEDSFNNGEKSKLHKTIEKTIELMLSVDELILTKNGEAYIKKETHLNFV